MGHAELYSTMISIAFHGRIGGAPPILIDTMRCIALISLEIWRFDEKAMVTFAKEYLQKNNYEWKAWDHDMQTAAALWRLQDLFEYIVLELA